jgi:glycerol kinase
MHVLAFDQGTTGTTTALYDQRGVIIQRAYREVHQIYPRPGWVEHDPMEIWQTLVDTAGEVVERHPGTIAAIGITNQRETTVLWDRKTGDPLFNAIVWQCRRTSDICSGLSDHEATFRRKTGLPIDPYFSGTKIRWILENTPGYRPEDVLFGTIDSWLIWKLTGGKVHATDYTNASRTLLFDIREKRWDSDLCRVLGVPPGILPLVKRSIDDYGVVESIPHLKGVPIMGVAGDQQAALFGQTCFSKGQVKNTYGTGCFVVINTGSEAITSRRGLITTLAVDGRGEPCYAMEGSIFIAGAAIQWLRDELRILERSADSERAALSIEDTDGVYLVPAFVGLGAPHWDMQARGVLVGLTRGTNRNHIVRAALESMAYQTYDVLSAMEDETQMRVEKLAVDGGAASNDFLMQFQADIIERPVVRAAVIESTSLGAAYLAGLGGGVWRDSEELLKLKTDEREFHPSMDKNRRRVLLEGWRKALRQAMVK